MMCESMLMSIIIRIYYSICIYVCCFIDQFQVEMSMT